ncbi:TrkH family potassium uptake protein [Candidatus Puniceispirillum sp.]|nr:TrkH family potassium uptake protein [Candidatus Puniceispirillum sp.]
MQLSPVLNILGLLATILAAAMLIPMCVDLYFGSDDWQVFALSALLTGFVGVSVWVATSRHEELDLGLRQAFLLTNGSWVTIGIFGALPFMFSELDLSITDSIFESVSGITTTGSTVLVEIEKASPGVLIWRALLQWLGGVGIVVMAMAILPMLSVGGMQLFRTESFERAEKVVPRATQLAGGIGLVYTALTAIWAVMLALSGMNLFDAVAHSMTTLATGGFSTRTASIGAFDSVAVEWVIMAGMIVGSLPFAHYLAIVRGGWHSLLNDPQVRWFMMLVVGLISLLCWHLMQNGLEFADALRQASFNGISLMTGTGYVSANFSAWGGFATTILLIVMFIGGCGGSTTCGIKVFRLQVLASTAKVQISRLLRPHAVALAYYNKRPVSVEVMDSVMGFFYLYILGFVIIALLLGMTGLEFLTALSGAATSISNVGPGLGEVIGAEGNFSSIPDSAKWIMSFAMLLGRLEIFTVLVMLSPGFWQR